MDLLDTLTAKGLRGETPTREEALAVLATTDDELLDVVAAAGRVRRRWFGRRVKLNYLVNLKSGLCPEDCSYCSQRLGSKAEILKYTWLKPGQAAEAARAGVSGGAKRVCLVASGRGPTDRDIDRVTDTVAAIKEADPAVEICACLGLLSDNQAERLKAAGVDAYNHNLNTSEGTYGDIATTHTYADRVDTVQKAHGAGLSACSGLIAGMGESDEDLVDVVFALRELGSDSVPVNFLIPFEGTPLAKEWNLSPQRCLRILAMVRFVNPDTEVRIAGGREVHLRSMQPLGLHLANSIFLGDYLTSEGQAGQTDLDMIADAGFEVEGVGESTLPRHRADIAAAPTGGCGTGAPGGAGGGCGTAAVPGGSEGADAAVGGGCGTGGGCGPCGGHGHAVPAATADRAVDGTAATVPAGSDEVRTDLVRVRRRGAGTELAPNA
ncbi:biotin synthase BioB [Kitasatospora purpeofusca]|uniref:biotin synthase BioB n=1 Tax=Kitasatospora purpeofusca TaxID=67352 RepID=UPI00386740BB